MKKIIAILCIVLAGIIAFFAIRHAHTPIVPSTPEAVVQKTITCNETNGSDALTSAQLFDGPASEHADLAPDDETVMPQRWTLSQKAVSPDGYFLVCTYAASKAVITRPVPAGSVCEGRNDQNLTCR